MKKSKGHLLCDAIIGESNESSQVNGAKRLRDVVKWMNERDERLNEGKGHLELILEFNKETDYGRKRMVKSQ